MRSAWLSLCVREALLALVDWLCPPPLPVRRGASAAGGWDAALAERLRRHIARRLRRGGRLAA